MLTVKLLGNARVKVMQVSRPEAGKGWVVIKTKASGICGREYGRYDYTQ